MEANLYKRTVSCSHDNEAAHDNMIVRLLVFRGDHVHRLVHHWAGWKMR